MFEEEDVEIARKLWREEEKSRAAAATAEKEQAEREQYLKLKARFEANS